MRELSYPSFDCVRYPPIALLVCCFFVWPCSLQLSYPRQARVARHFHPPCTMAA